MKRATLPGILCLLFALQAAASEAFLLQIPKRNIANQEIGEVRITLGLDVPPGNSQLSVGSSTTLNLGDTATVDGDEVSFTAGTGNSVHIRYRPLSNFGADFCAGANAADRNIRMRFVGAPDVLDYRISSYVVAAPLAAPLAACGKVSRRAGELPANLAPEPDGDTPMLEAVFRGRHELDVVLVLDASGSMNGRPPGATTGPTKAELLRSALTTFVAQWAELDAPFEGAGEWPADRIGVIFFDDAPSPQTIPGADAPQNFFVRRGPGSGGAGHPWTAVRTTIDTLAPGLTTALGPAINSALQQWLADPDNDLTIVAVTDGIQNVVPLIETDANGWLTLAPPDASIPARLAERFVPIQSVGFGTPAAVDEALLKAMSEQTAGVSYTAVDADSIFESFAFTLVALLKGNTASIAASHRGSGAGEHEVIVDGSAQRVVFSLQWAPPDTDAVTLEVFRPGSNVPATAASTTRTAHSIVQSFVPASSDRGVWRVRVAPEQKKVPYTLTTFFNERHLDYRLGFDTAQTRTGDAIRLRASVAYDGKPLTGLPANAIRARVRRPAEGLGTILHQAKSFDPVAAGNDPLSPYQTKVAGVVDAHVVQRIAPKTDAGAIALVEEKPGVYAATFSGTSVPGTYAFEVVLDWDDGRTGRLHREERVERSVTVKVDPARSEVRRRGNVVTVIPRDAFGNFLGPGYATRFNAAADDPRQSGAYELTVAEGTPIVVDGVTLHAPDVVTPPAPSGAWRLFLAAGPNFPEWSFNGGIERLLSPQWSVEGIAGLHRRNDDDLTQWSLGGKRWLGHAFVNFGAGAYDSAFGAHAGAGVLWNWLEVTGNVHATDGDTFATLQLGVRFGF